MREVSFVIPIRVDTPDRLENCDAVLRFLELHFPDAEIQLVEQDRETQTAALRARHPGVVWHFERNEKHFSRGAAINTGLLRSKRRCVCAYDTDILLDPAALRRAATLISSRQWPIVLPFNHIFVEVSGASRLELIKNLRIEGLSRIVRLAKVPSHPEIAARVLSGAIMMCDREAIVLQGGYNSKMISYGWEDIEFLKRLEKLGYYSHMLSEFNLIHLEHRRGPDSRINEMYVFNKAEFDKVLKMPVSQLRKYVAAELRLGPEIEPRQLKALQRRRSLRNWVTLRKLASLANRGRVLWRVNGSAALAQRAMRVVRPA